MHSRVHRPSKSVVIRVLAVCLAFMSPQRLAAAIDAPLRQWVQATLDAWQVACDRDLHITRTSLPWIVVYDNVHAWHINPEPDLLPAHTRTSQTVRFSGRNYELFEVANKGTLWVPGREPMAIVPKTLTMLYADETRPFFIVGAPAFQERVLRVNTRDSGDFRNLLLGGVLHELTHTRQLPHLIAQIKHLQSRDKYPDSLDDNVIQTVFAANDGFHRMYEQECARFSAAVQAAGPEAARTEAAEGLRIVEQRRRRFLVGQYGGWSDMEDVFLALEGSAMWVQYQSALRTAPREQPWLQTLATLGQHTDAWSQSEGLVIFLLIDRFSPGWQTRFFGTALPSPLAVLRDALDRSPH